MKNELRQLDPRCSFFIFFFQFWQMSFLYIYINSMVICFQNQLMSVNIQNITGFILICIKCICISFWSLIYHKSTTNERVLLRTHCPLDVKLLNVTNEIPTTNTITRFIFQNSFFYDLDLSLIFLGLVVLCIITITFSLRVVR